MNYGTLARQRLFKQAVLAVAFVAIMAAGWRFPLLGYFIPLCMLLGMGLALFQGRKWCDWYCPRGSFFDSAVKPLSPNRPIPTVITGMPMRVAAMAFLMAMMTVQLYSRWPDGFSIGHLFVMMLTGTTILGLLLSIIYQQRSWCYLCPIGTMSNWVGKSRRPMSIDAARCNDCRRCQAVCPMHINPQQFKVSGRTIVRHGDCLKCRLCVAACPSQALTP